jgi:type I restriction enzyme, S subunit
MSNRDKAALLPKLRFPEFRGALGWKETRLGQLGELVSGLTYSPNDVRETGLLVLRSSNVQNGKIALDDCVYVDPATKGANLSQANDILICVRNGSAALIGKNALIPEGMPPCTHGAFMTVFRSKSAEFVFQLFQSDKYQKQVAGDLGATINSINGGQLVKYTFAVPQPSEQQKVAVCLSSLDELIAAQAHKVAALKTHKKGLMQQLFPREGESQPRLRFPEFRDAGDWKVRALGSFSKVGDIDHKMPSSVIDGIPYIMTGNFFGMNGIDFDNAKKVSTEDYEQLVKKIKPEFGDIVVARYASVGAVRYIETKSKFLVSYSCAIVKCNKSEHSKYLYYIFQSDVIQSKIGLEINASSQKNIGIDSIKKLNIFLPTLPEQQKIADCLTTLDTLINTTTQEFETLKTHKKGLMQQLFPSAEAVEA